MPNIIRDVSSALTANPKPQGPIKGFMLGLNADGSIMFKPPLALQFMYNPSKMSDEKSTQWVVTPIPGRDTPMYAWSCGGERTIEFRLFLNAYEYGTPDATTLINIPGLGGIRSELAKLESFMYSAPSQYKNFGSGLLKGAAAGIGNVSALAYVNVATNNSLIVGGTSPAQFTPPPKCLFGYGTDIHECIVKKVDKEITMWNRDLDPIRAEVHISLAVDENGPRAVASRALRETLMTMGLLSVNPAASLPIRGGRIF